MSTLGGVWSNRLTEPCFCRFEVVVPLPETGANTWDVTLLLCTPANTSVHRFVNPLVYRSILYYLSVVGQLNAVFLCSPHTRSYSTVFILLWILPDSFPALGAGTFCVQLRARGAWGVVRILFIPSPYPPSGWAKFLSNWRNFRLQHLGQRSPASPASLGIYVLS